MSSVVVHEQHPLFFLEADLPSHTGSQKKKKKNSPTLAIQSNPTVRIHMIAKRCRKLKPATANPPHGEKGSRRTAPMSFFALFFRMSSPKIILFYLGVTELQMDSVFFIKKIQRPKYMKLEQVHS